MSETITHSIGKLSFHLKGVGTEKVFAIRQQAASYLQDNFVRMAEEVFDEFALNDELIFIQHLSINLQFASDSFDLKKQEYRFREQIREQVAAHVRRRQNISFIQKQESDEQLQQQFEHNDRIHQPQQAYSPAPENLLLKTWAFYLEHGYLPAYIPFGIWQQRLYRWKKTIAETGNQPKDFFIQQLSDVHRLNRFLKFSLPDERQWIFDQLHPQLNVLLSKGKVKFNHSVPFTFVELKTYLLYLFTENKTVLQSEKDLPAFDRVMRRHHEVHYTVKKMFSGAKQNSEKTNTFLKPVDETIIVHNAGIVLLQPFITTLFNELHILSEDRKTIIDTNKACTLLSVLAGDKEQSEIYYPLYKLLCGVPLHEVIDSNVELTTKEREECFHLLQQVIVHWTALKQSSAPSLQQTFLQRTGKLSQKEDKWLLQVEQRTEDVLMQYLPWSYSIIRYTWMKQALFTEWT